MDDLRKRVLSWIDEDREVFLDFLGNFVRAKSPNPPGDTLEAAKVIEDFLTERQLPYRIIAPNKVMPNFVGTFDGANPGRHVVFNGHIDVFPVGDGGTWTQDPWGGAIVDGKMYGRGVNDMKSGTASVIFAFMYLHRLRDHLRGRVTMTAVSDEETFGPDGARYLIEHNPEIHGDICLSTEPTGIHSVRSAEKGPLWLKFTVRTPGAHGAYPHKSQNANEIAARLILALDELRNMDVQTPAHIARALEGVEDVIDKVASPGASKVLQKVSLNIGTVNGGVKQNMLPGVCVVTADIRVPVGLSPDAVIARAQSIVDRFPEAEMEVIGRQEPLWSDPNHEMCKLIQRNVQELAGFTPPAIVSLPGTDARLWRGKGVPAFVYGVTPFNVAMADEYVDIEEVFHVLKTHTLSALDFLMAEK
ncbi:M20/M25/M40 family metallo-hydrolase [Thalassobaculum sp.]|uniref:M20/M25/M40 family metallo-hydrolase n=1 Tax=Thalassobaculum sp. TaxID=2022740 RepID=UPI0032F045AD